MVRKLKLERKYFIPLACAVAFATIFSFQNCSQDVGFRLNDDADSVKLGTAEVNTYEFDPNFRQNKPEIHVTTILDNSGSMEVIRQRVAEALPTVVSNLKGFGGQVSLVTTTQDNNQIPERGNQRPEEVSYKTERVYRYDENGVTKYVSQVSDVPSNKNYQNVLSYLIADPFLPQDQALIFKQSYTDGEFENFRNEFATAIEGVSVLGSDKEQGLCSLWRSAQKNLKDHSGAFHAYVVATNEDDATTLDSCPLESVRDYVAVASNPLQAACSAEEKANGSCVYTYKLTYEKEVDLVQRSRYYYQTIDRIRYQIDNQTVTSSANADYRVATDNYRLYENQRKYTYQFFEKYIEDNVVREGLIARTRDLNVESALCPADSSTYRNCSTAERNQLESLLSAANSGFLGLNDGAEACKIKCTQNSRRLVAQASVPRSGEVCSSTSTVNESQSFCVSKITAAGNGSSIPNNYSFNSCESQCTNSQFDLPITVNYPAVNESNCPISSTCDANDKQALYDANKNSGLTGFTSVDQIVNCSVSSTCGTAERQQTYSIDITDSNFRCPTTSDRDATVNNYRSATSAEIQAIADKHGLPTSDIRIVRVDCYQNLEDANRRTENVSSCTNYSDCTNSEFLDLVHGVRNHTHVGAEDKVYCTGTCEQQTANTCEVSSSQGDICSDPAKIANLQANCPISATAVESCQIIQERSPQEVFHHQADGPEYKVDYGTNSKTEVTRQILEQHGSGFFLAAFVNRPDEIATCPTAAPSIGPDQTYTDLEGLLGSSGAKTFSNCDSSYQPALDVVFDQIQNLVNSIYVVDQLVVGRDRVYSVVVQYADGHQLEVPKSMYREEGQNVVFNDPSILFEATRVSIAIAVPKPGFELLGFDKPEDE